ncbi:MAG: hypothetical protein WA672_21265, partial [Candidatus Angelobacter sp.]
LLLFRNVPPIPVDNTKLIQSLLSVEVLTSSKSFADEYAVAHSFWLNYVFRLADVESFAAQKIDAQQLLDRGHITNDQIGRITMKLVGAN